MKVYTGVGARATPKEILKVMTRIAEQRSLTHIVRTGGAAGADEQFEVAENKILYLPWNKFRGKEGIGKYTKEQEAFADKILQKVFPYTYNLKHVTRLMFRRNVFQVVGLCDRMADVEPSEQLVCWTPDGAENAMAYNIETTGGTGIAILIADYFDVPVYNLQRPETLQEVLEYLKP